MPLQSVPSVGNQRLWRGIPGVWLAALGTWAETGLVRQAAPAQVSGGNREARVATPPATTAKALPAVGKRPLPAPPPPPHPPVKGETFSEEEEEDGGLEETPN